jgi:O-antigen ligase
MNRSPLIMKSEPLIRIGLFLLLACYFILVQFSASHLYIKMFSIPVPAILTLGLGSLLLLYYLVYRRPSGHNLKNDKYITLFLILFTTSILLSILSALYTATVINSVEYMNYLKGSLVSRTAYYFSYILFLYFGYLFLTANIKTSEKVIKVYPLSIYILIVVAVWQLGYFVYNIPFLDLNTRSYLHSVTGISMFDFRLTSFTDEPSYVGPFLIDMIILSYLVFKKKWIYVIAVLPLSLFVLLFSFSVSGYLNIFLIVAALVLFLIFHPQFPKKILWIAFLGLGILLIGLVVVKPDLLMKFFTPIVGRADNLFDPQASSRIYMYVMPFFWLFDHSWISALFGYGPGAYEFLSSTKVLPNSGSVSTSSNNMYIDILFEHGIIGFLLLLAGLGFIAYYLVKNSRTNAYYFVALLEFIHLLITSLYRADYVSPRFWTVLLIIFLLMKIGDMKKKVISSDGVNELD